VTTPNQPAPAGAFVVGGGDYHFGQDLVEDQIRSMFSVPNPKSGNALEILANELSKLPLDVLQMFKDLIPDPLEWIWDTVDGAVDAIMHALTTPPLQLLKEAVGVLEDLWNQFADLVQGLIITPLNGAMSVVADWFSGLTDAIGDGVKAVGSVVDDLWSGLMRTLGFEKSSSDVANAATQLSQQAKDAIDLGEWNNAILGVRQNKHIMQGIDETEESTFLMSDLFNADTVPPHIEVTSAEVPIAFWRAEEWAKKGFISWFGEGYTDITGLYVDIYKLDYETSTMVLLHSSADLSGIADDEWRYMVYYMPEIHRFEVFPGDVIGIGLRVTGTGVHKVGAKSAPWLPPHPSVVPAKPAATRTGIGDLPFASITYSGYIPWFGIGIVTGDTPPLFFTPRTTQFPNVGTHTYTIPSWAKYLDVTLVGGGGGGKGGSAIVATHGEGGGAGSWASETLERGVHFAPDATELTIIVGAGGNGGDVQENGSTGGSTFRAAIPAGKAVFTAAGGAGGNGFGAGDYAEGDSPGNHTYGGTTFIGGGTAPSNSATKGSTGRSPGGGGGGGAGGYFGIAWDGGKGGSGGGWVVARQS
jgi:hypothetical protein